MEDLPKIPAWFQNGFHRFLGPYLRRHFHAIAVESESLRHAEIDIDQPLIVYANHPSWWDPLLAHFLNKTLFSGRQFWAPIDAEALKQYEVFKKLGFFGVQSESKSGASTFLRMSQRVLEVGGNPARCKGALWITPEGRFADARDRTAPLMPGLAHVCHRMTSGRVIPLAMEYVFWDERSPMCLVRLGDPILIGEGSPSDKTAWAERLAGMLRQNQDQLASLAIARNSKPFTNLLAGKSGAGGIYDWMRRGKSFLSGKEFRPNHGDQF
ncbi:MAG: lysophospholipid acyltransferase family protein [Planctomycetota bacterium]